MSDCNENWKPVLGFEGLYEVSDLGRVVSIKRISNVETRRNKAVFVDNNGYHRMLIWKDGKGHTRSVHRMVAEAFIGPRPRGMIVNHIDGNKANNAVGNLEFTTCAGNSRHAVELGLTARGENARSAKVTERQVREMRLLYGELSGLRIAKAYGLSRSATYSILTRKTWKHVS